MNDAGRDEQHLAGMQRHGWLTLHHVFERAFEHVDDFLARMPVTAECRTRIELHAHLNDFASTCGEIVALQFDAPLAFLVQKLPAAQV